MSAARVAILLSGRGSCAEALIRAAAGPGYPARIALALSNNPKAEGLERASRLGVPTAAVDHRPFRADRAAHEAAVSEILEAHGADFIALAGYMRILTPGFVRAWSGRMINIHPSLLPLFPGLDTHARALSAGMKLHGCTVHWVEPEVDAGAIIGQAAVPVLPGDDADALAHRVLQAEHRLYPACLAAAVGGRSTPAPEDSALLNPEGR